MPRYFNWITPTSNVACPTTGLECHLTFPWEIDTRRQWSVGPPTPYTHTHTHTHTHKKKRKKKEMFQDCYQWPLSWERKKNNTEGKVTYIYNRFLFLTLLQCCLAGTGLVLNMMAAGSWANINSCRKDTWDYFYNNNHRRNHLQTDQLEITALQVIEFITTSHWWPVEQTIPRST